MEEIIKHGGKREGAGRKASGKVGKSYYLTLSPEASEKLKSIGRDKSEYVERLIMADIKRGVTLAFLLTLRKNLFPKMLATFLATFLLMLQAPILIYTSKRDIVT